MITNTITLRNDTHGTFQVTTAHLNKTTQAHSGWALDGLINRIDALTGSLSDYSDLNWVEALIVLSYLTGGDATAL